MALARTSETGYTSQDHCEAIDLVLTKGQPGQIYNVGAGNEVSNIEIVRKILKHLGKDQNKISLRRRQAWTRHTLQLGLFKNTIRTRLETQALLRKSAERNHRLVRPQRVMVETASHRTNPESNTLEEKVNTSETLNNWCKRPPRHKTVPDSSQEKS